MKAAEQVVAAVQAQASEGGDTLRYMILLRNSGLLFAILVVAQCAHAAVYRCQSPDGKVVFQDHPCDVATAAELKACPDADGKLIYQRGGCYDWSKTRAREAARIAAADRQDQAERSARAADLRVQGYEAQRNAVIGRAAAQGLPAIGMSASQLAAVMGTPDRYYDSYSARGASRQMIYVRGERTLHVFLDDGVVTSIQDTATIGPAPAPRPMPTFGKLVAKP